MLKVSVIVPVYNVAKFLRQCMDSLVGQTLREIEIICVDDGSADGSGAILDEYAAKDPRVKVIHQANAGAGPARNAGMAVATGEYLFFCDPDDWCARRMLAGMFRQARNVRADVLLAPTYRCDSVTGRRTGVRRPQKRIRGVFSGMAAEGSLFSISYHTIWDKLFRREFVVSAGLAFQPVRRFNDMLFCDLALALAERMVMFRTPGYFHRVARRDGLHVGAGLTPELALTVYDGLRTEMERRGIFERYRADYATALFNHGCGLMLDSFDFATCASFYGEWQTRMDGLEIDADRQLDVLGRSMARAFRPGMTCEEFLLALAKVANGLRLEAQRSSLVKGLKMICRSATPFWLKARR